MTAKKINDKFYGRNTDKLVPFATFRYWSNMKYFSVDCRDKEMFEFISMQFMFILLWQFLLRYPQNNHKLSTKTVLPVHTLPYLYSQIGQTEKNLLLFKLFTFLMTKTIVK